MAKVAPGPRRYPEQKRPAQQAGEVGIPTFEPQPVYFSAPADGLLSVDMRHIQQLLAAKQTEGQQDVLLTFGDHWECGQLGPPSRHEKDNKSFTLSIRWHGDAAPCSTADTSFARKLGNSRDNLPSLIWASSDLGVGCGPLVEDEVRESDMEDHDDEIKEFTKVQMHLRRELQQARKSSIRRQYLLAGLTVLLYYTFGVVYYSLQEDWSFVDAIYFVTVTLTTVGYGSLVPSSDGAKGMTIVFVLVGMFLWASALGAISGLLIEKLEALDDAEDGKEQDFIPEPWGTVVYASLLVMGGVTVGTVFFATAESDEFDFMDALYMSVMSVTTVGYGDLAASTEGGRLFACFWLLGGVICTGKAIGDVAHFVAKRTQNAAEKRRLKRNVTVRDLMNYGGADGKLDKNEFALCKLRAMGRVSKQDIKNCFDQFHVMDCDGGGVIDCKDMIHYSFQDITRQINKLS